MPASSDPCRAYALGSPGLLSPFGDREVPTDGGSRPRVFRTGAIGFVAAVAVQRRVRSSKLVCGTTAFCFWGRRRSLRIFYFDSKYPIRNTYQENIYVDPRQIYAEPRELTLLYVLLYVYRARRYVDSVV